MAESPVLVCVCARVFLCLCFFTFVGRGAVQRSKEHVSLCFLGARKRGVGGLAGRGACRLDADGICGQEGNGQRPSDKTHSAQKLGFRPEFSYSKCAELKLGVIFPTCWFLKKKKNDLTTGIGVFLLQGTNKKGKWKDAVRGLGVSCRDALNPRAAGHLPNVSSDVFKCFGAFHT